MSDTLAPRWYVTMWWHAYLPDEPAWSAPVTLWLTAHIEAHGDMHGTLTSTAAGRSGASATLSGPAQLQGTGAARTGGTGTLS